MLSWNLNNKYGIVQVQPRPQPGDQITCKPPDKRSFYTGIILSTNADGTYDVEFAAEVRIREYDNGYQLRCFGKSCKGKSIERDTNGGYTEEEWKEMKEEALAEMF